MLAPLDPHDAAQDERAPFLNFAPSAHASAVANQGKNLQITSSY